MAETLMQPPDPTRDRLLGVIVAILALGALKAAEPVALPLTFSLFVVLLAHPLQVRLRRWVPPGAADGLTLLALLGIGALFTWALIESADEVLEWLRASQPRLEALAASLKRSLAESGLALAAGGPGGDATQLAQRLLRPALSGLMSASGFVLLVTALCVLALREVDEFRQKLDGPLRTRWDSPLIDSAGVVVTQLQSYVLTRCFTSALTGALTGLVAWAVGLPLALPWAVLTCLLNFIPTLGTLAAVAGITLFAAVHFQTLGMTALVFGATGVLQVVIGSYVDPRLQARRLSLSPFAVLVSVVFWGWMWGIPGALIGVPLTAALMIAFRQFPATRWLAQLLDNEREARDPA